MSSEPDADSTPNVVWDADSTHPELMEGLRQQLQQVTDPEIGLSIIDLGLVRNVVITDNEALVTMILTTPFCPYGPALLEMTRTKAEEAIKLKVTLEMGIEMWDFSMMADSAGGDWGLF
jgi:metal-sulfur cluster biosynthetic enzyme